MTFFSYAKFVGATVVAVSRSQEKLTELHKALPAGTNTSHLIDVVGDFSSEAHGDQTRDKVNAAIKVIFNGCFLALFQRQLITNWQGQHIDHVVSVLGFFKEAPGGPSVTPVKNLTAAFEDGLYPNIVAAHAFLPALKQREGATFTLVSGGFGHFCPAPQYWMATVKNAALNALTLGE